jgi:nitrite reductase/ring-hydroxylating ferredoxin subunit
VSPPPSQRRLLAPASALPAGEALAFTGLVRGEERPCFALRIATEGGSPARFGAYVNVCAHRNQPVVVDRLPFDPDGLVECRAHGARYEAATGECVEGPCVGAKLVPVTIECIDGQLYALDDDCVDDSIYGDDFE